jgi:hypothetical protein
MSSSNALAMPVEHAAHPEPRRGAPEGGAAADVAGEKEFAARAILILPDQALTVACLAGEVWMTCDRDDRDFIVRAGQGVDVRRGDRAVLQALRPSRIRWRPSSCLDRASPPVQAGEGMEKCR